MNLRTAAVVLVLASIPIASAGAGRADPILCASMERVATETMAIRQAGVPKEAVLAVFLKHGANPALVDAAYRQPRGLDEYARDYLTLAFAIKVRISCEWGETP